MTDFIYSFRIAASGLMFIAFNAGKIPAVIPTNAANISAAIDSQEGIREMLLPIPIPTASSFKKWFIT